MKREPIEPLTECPRAWRDRPSQATDGRPILYVAMVGNMMLRARAASQFAKANLDYDGYLDFGPGYEYMEVVGGQVRIVMARDVA